MSTADILRQEGRHEGEQMGRILAGRQDVIEAFEIRFALVSDGLCEEIELVADSARLHLLLRAAIRCADLESSTKEIKRTAAKTSFSIPGSSQTGLPGNFCARMEMCVFSQVFQFMAR